MTKAFFLVDRTKYDEFERKFKVKLEYHVEGIFEVVSCSFLYNAQVKCLHKLLLARGTTYILSTPAT